MNLESNRATGIILITVLVAHAMLMAFPAVAPSRTGLVRTILLDVLTPIEMLFDATTHGTGSLWTNYVALIGTRQDNERLRAEIAALRMEMDKNREDVSEAERLRRLLDLDHSGPGRRVVARVIGSDTSLSRRTVTIDKGRTHGLFADAPVVTPDGVVGRVIHTGHFSSIVQLLSDVESGVGVVVRGSRVQGIVRGDGSNQFLLDHIDDDSILAPGNELLTSGTDQIYPKGLRVGVITVVEPAESLIRTARIQPAADLGKLEEVLCLIDTPRSTELIEGLGLPPAP
jgi:rod shape-determining protein MreC